MVLSIRRHWVIHGPSTLTLTTQGPHRQRHPVFLSQMEREHSHLSSGHRSGRSVEGDCETVSGKNKTSVQRVAAGREGDGAVITGPSDDFVSALEFHKRNVFSAGALPTQASADEGNGSPTVGPTDYPRRPNAARKEEASRT